MNSFVARSIFGSLVQIMQAARSNCDWLLRNKLQHSMRQLEW